jgi:hypothetical protein
MGASPARARNLLSGGWTVLLRTFEGYSGLLFEAFFWYGSVRTGALQLSGCHPSEVTRAPMGS